MREAWCALVTQTGCNCVNVVNIIHLKTTKTRCQAKPVGSPPAHLPSSPVNYC